jgi:hypothetical protein
MILVTVSGISIIVLRTGNLLRAAYLAAAPAAMPASCAGYIPAVDSPTSTAKRHHDLPRTHWTDLD